MPMQSVARIKGTSAGSFTIGLQGATLYQGSSTSQVASPQLGDLFIQTGSTPKVLQYCGSSWLALTPSPQWIEATGASTIESNYNYFVDTSSSAFTLTLPSSPNMGDRITLLDATGSFATNALTINPNGLTIMGQTGKMLQLSDNNVAVELVFYNSTYGWRILDTSAFSQNYV
jgi:hypothetical protein